mmetsp:Transcript_39035/g.91531  ORF Transcript_39035/g.91531 Transcript_39035/m.91531 type:complete len:220 (-) Transcript_39035:56-715(-)
MGICHSVVIGIACEGLGGSGGGGEKSRLRNGTSGALPACLASSRLSIRRGGDGGLDFREGAGALSGKPASRIVGSTELSGTCGRGGGGGGGGPGESGDAELPDSSTVASIGAGRRTRGARELALTWHLSSCGGGGGSGGSRSPSASSALKALGRLAPFFEGAHIPFSSGTSWSPGRLAGLARSSGRGPEGQDMCLGGFAKGFVFGSSATSAFKSASKSC